jgi:hypothetical protein
LGGVSAQPLSGNISNVSNWSKADREFLEEGFFLQKPFSRSALVSKVGEALTHVMQTTN